MSDYDRDNERSERRPRRDNRDSGYSMGGKPNRRRKGRGRAEYCPEGKCFDYKDVDSLERFVNEVGKIKPRRVTNNCARCQRELAREVKRARFLGLMPYISTND